MNPRSKSVPSRPPWLTWLYTHNPFYAISAALLIYGIRTAFGKLEIGSINCWIMFGVLTGYTLLLATIAVMIIRFGKVWDDARSLLVLLLLLFLGVSISTDDLLVNSTSKTEGAVLVLSCFVGTAILSELVLWATRIRLPWGYRGPYHLLLALFCIFPWLCSPAMRPESSLGLEWLIFLFPTGVALLFFLLIPAVRQGPKYVSENGTPWPWPWYPWTIFSVLAGVTALRSFVLTMTYGPLGPIWKGAGNSLSSINFETIFGAYFLIPLAFAIVWLILEASLVSKNLDLQKQILCAAPAMLLMAYPFDTSAVFNNFLHDVTARCGSPLWLTCWLLMAFYSRAWLGNVRHASAGFTAVLLLLVVIQPDTLRTFHEVNPWPWIGVGVLGAVIGLRCQSSGYCFLALVVCASGMWMVLPDGVSPDLRRVLTYHVVWGGVLALGLSFRDEFAKVLRATGAALIPMTSIVVLLYSRVDLFPWSWRVVYLCLIAGGALLIAVAFRQRWYLFAFGAIVSLAVYVGAVAVFRYASDVVGRESLTALSWSVAALIVAFLISASKANWISLERVTRWVTSWIPLSVDATASPDTSPPELEVLDDKTDHDDGSGGTET